MLKKVAGYLLIVILTIALFDVAAYYLVPEQLTKAFTHYRCPDCVKVKDVRGNGRYPYDYFVSHPERGFDLGIGRRNRLHTVDGHAYQIWTNELGCFDREQSPDKPYIYVAGDSHTWGYTPYRLKFATLLESKTSVDVLKCGVTHTGQYHQASKLKDISKRLGINPTVTFVGFFNNDIQNDLAYPHSTVVKGWQIDYARLERLKNTIYGRTAEDLNAFKERKEKELGGKGNPLEKLDYVKLKPIGWHYRYMLSYNIFKAAKTYLKSKKTHDIPRIVDIYNAPIIEKNGILDYTNNPNAAENKKAILEIVNFNRSVGSNLVMILIPPYQHWNKIEYFRELTDFLNENEISFIDMTTVFANQQTYVKNQVYWDHDHHIREGGNVLIAQEMANWLQGNKADLLK